MSVKELEKKQKPAEEEITVEEETTPEAETTPEEIVTEEEASAQDKKKPLFQVAYKRDDAVLEAFITFNYRVVHPKVLLRSILYAIVFITFGIVASSVVFSAICFLLAAFCIGLVLTRKKISLNMTKRDDADYQNGTEFTYNFTETGARMLRNGKPEVYAKSYKKSVTTFFGDQGFYYLVISPDDLFILPKNRFTIGDPDEFEKFIIKKTGLEMRWIPYGMKGVLNSLKNFSEQPMIDTEGWKEIVGKRFGRSKDGSKPDSSRAAGAPAKEEAPEATVVKPKSLKSRSKKDKTDE